MTGGEHEAQQIVADVVIEGSIEVGHAHLLLRVELVSDLLVFALDSLAAAMHVDGAMLGGGHEPGAGVVRHSGLRPPLECGHESILSEIFGESNVTSDARQSGNESRRLDSPDGIDGTVDVGHDSWLPRRFGSRAIVPCVYEPRGRS